MNAPPQIGGVAGSIDLEVTAGNEDDAAYTRQDHASQPDLDLCSIRAAPG
jgi:hypothetical protein